VQVNPHLNQVSEGTLDTAAPVGVVSRPRDLTSYDWIRYQEITTPATD
jgi:hypothetical protein